MDERGPRTYYWMVTISGQHKDELDKLKAKCEKDECRAVGQWEEGKCHLSEDVGYLHWQGYVEWCDRMRLSQLKKVCGTAHWEARKGTAAQAISYCSKDDTQVEDTEWLGDWTDGTKDDLGGGGNTNRATREPVWLAAERSTPPPVSSAELLMDAECEAIVIKRLCRLREEVGNSFISIIESCDEECESIYEILKACEVGCIRELRAWRVEDRKRMMSKIAPKKIEED